MRFVSAVALLTVLTVPVAAQAQIDTSHIRVKKAIADSMTAEELVAYKERLARNFAAPAPKVNFDPSTLAPADTCVATTPEISGLPYNPPADTTVGMVDDFDLPADTAAPTCTAPTNCTGAGPAGSLPRGGIYTGTGTAPDRAYQIQVDQNCSLNITMDPTGAQDLSLIVYEAQCSSSLADCVCVDDTGVGGVAESVALDAVAGTTYFIVVDGYSTGGTPPGPSGPFTLSITETTATGCMLTPVELQSFEVL